MEGKDGFDLYDAHDVLEPDGRCMYCGNPFGTWSNGDFITYRFDQSNVCTECQYFIEQEEKERNRRTP